MNKELVVSPGYKGGLGGRAWSPGLRVGPWLFLSGITSVDYRAGKTVGRGDEPAPFTQGRVDPEAQWRQVLSNIKEIIEGAGQRGAGRCRRRPSERSSDTAPRSSR